MNKKNVIVIADSISNGNRITSYLLTVPQIIVKELLRHRMFSFSSSSMRAIPFNKVLEDIRENMFVPLAFQSHHSGMQGSEYLMGEESEKAKQQWIESGLRACEEAERLYNLGVTKQLCSRIIEPFGYAKILITATEFENFFELRCPQYRSYDGDSKVLFRSKKDFLKFKGCPNDSSDILYFLKHNESQAEIHIQALAESMWDAMNESVPKELASGEWHIPFGDKINSENLAQSIGFKISDYDWYNKELWSKIQIATARCARLSYITHDGEINYEKDIKLHDQLLRDKHYSPFEHCARAMSEDEYYEFAKGRMLVRDGYGYGDSLEQDIDNGTNGWCNNLRGWISYRYIIENEKLH